MRIVRNAQRAVVIGCISSVIGCGGPDPAAVVPAPNEPPAVTTPDTTPSTESGPQPSIQPIAPPPRDVGSVSPPAYSSKAFTPPTFAWRTSPVAMTTPVPKDTPEPKTPTPTTTEPTTPPEPEPKPKTPEPEPKPGEPAKDPKKEPEKPFEWPKDVNGKNVGEWVEDFRDSDPAVRELAVRMIPSFGPAARPIAGRKVMMMIAEDPDPGVRMAAMTTAGLLGHESKDDIKPMIYALRMAIGRTYNGSAIRLFATRALATYGEEAADAINVITKIYQDPWWETRQAVAQALGRIGAPVFDDPPAKDPRTGQPVPKRPYNDQAQKYLLQMAQKDECVAVRQEAVFSLISLGPPYTVNPSEYAAIIQPSLVVIDARLNPKRKELGEQDKAVQIWLHVYTVMLDDRAYKDTLPKIAEYLKEPAAMVRAHALMAIGAMGKRAASQEVLAAVRDALLYEEEILVAAAVDCLMAIGPDAVGVLPDVEKLKERTKNEKLKEIAEEGITVLSGKKKWEDVQKERQKAAEEALRRASIPEEKKDD